MVGIADELLLNIKNFCSSAKLIHNQKDYTSAFILYFKAMLAISDYVLLVNGKGIPKDHSNRFRLLERSFPEVYTIIDRFFPDYQCSYTTAIKKELCEEAGFYVKLLAEKYKIKEIA